MTVPAPLLRNSLELLGHAVEHYLGASSKDRRIAVQLFVAILWARWEGTYSYEKTCQSSIAMASSSRVGPALRRFGEVWGVGTTPRLAEIDLLRDELNARQHRYGTIDEFTMDYYMEITFYFHL